MTDLKTPPTQVGSFELHLGMLTAWAPRPVVEVWRIMLLGQETQRQFWEMRLR